MTFTTRPSSAAVTPFGVVPDPGASPDGPDVQTVATGELITSTWGISVAADLAELWSTKIDQATLDAHVIPATAITATPNSPPMTGTDVQTQLQQASAALNKRTPMSYRSASAAIVPELLDENTMIVGARNSEMTCALPSNATLPFDIGTEIHFLNMTGPTGPTSPYTITFSAGSGATVNGTPGLKLRAKYSAATAKKIATNDWVLIGDLSA